jgi:predicted HicB family RNase H-like nuclease
MNDILQYKDYYATVHFSAEDEVFYGKIIGINDHVSFEGTTVKGLKMAFEDAMEDYLETCRGLKKEPDNTYKVFSMSTFRLNCTGRLRFSLL